MGIVCLDAADGDGLEAAFARRGGKAPGGLSADSRGCILLGRCRVNRANANDVGGLLRIDGVQFLLRSHRKPDELIGTEQSTGLG